MNKKKLLELIASKEARKSELVAKVESNDNLEELRSINSDLQKLNAEITELRGIADLMPEDPATVATSTLDPLVAASRSAAGQPQGKLDPVGMSTYGMGPVNQRNHEKDEHDKREQRGADLKARKPVIFMPEELRNYGLLPQLEKRAVTIGSSNLVTQTKYSNLLNPWFEQVSGLVDLVNAIPLQGGESYTQGFEKTSATGGYTDETSAYTSSDPTFDYVSIGKAKLTSYTELTDEVRKLPNVDYQNYVAQQMVISIRKKIGSQIVAGAGGANAITGIYNAPANVIDGTTDQTLGTIDQTTLDAIVFAYGGDEAVEGGQWLVLNKKDLAAFAQVRATTGQKLYNITLNGQTGTISSDKSYSVNFVINNACTQHSSATPPAAGTMTMLYGSPAMYELPVFSPIEVMESLDFKFSSGQMAFRAAMWVGGNVAKFNGWVRVKHS